MENKFKIYGTRGCSRCEVIKKLMDNKKIIYEYVFFEDLTEEEQNNIKNLIIENSKQQSFPLIFKNNIPINISEI